MGAQRLNAGEMQPFRVSLGPTRQMLASSSTSQILGISSPHQRLHIYNPITTPLMCIADGWEQTKRCDIGSSIHKQGKSFIRASQTSQTKATTPRNGAHNTPATRSLSSTRTRQADGHDGPDRTAFKGPHHHGWTS